MNDAGHSEGISIAPNPTTDHIQINTGTMLPKFIRLFDVQGKLIRECLPQKAVIDWDVHLLAKGVYYFHIGLDRGLIVRKVIVQ